MTISSPAFRLTPQGMLVSNEILQELFDAN